MDIYHVNEKVQIVKWHYGGRSMGEINRIFNETFPNRPSPSVTTIRRIIKNFEKHGCVSPRSHKQVVPVNDQEEIRDINILAAVNADPTLFSRRIAEMVNSSTWTVRRVLKKNGYRSYKIKKSHEIFPEDNIRRMEFCERVMEKANNDENFIRNIVFSDESTFPLHGRHNPSVVRYWSRENLHRFFTLRTQYPQKVNVWGGMLGDNMIGPFFIEGTLTGPKYLRLLQQQIVPEVRRIAGPRFDDVWFQQDGCPAHNTILVQEYLNNTFPNRIISGRGTILWPARSPDLAPNDFFLWGHVKSKIYGFQEHRANTLEDLRQKITDAFQEISPSTLSHVRQGFYDRLGYCLTQGGGLFEYLL